MLQCMEVNTTVEQCVCVCVDCIYSRCVCVCELVLLSGEVGWVSSVLSPEHSLFTAVNSTPTPLQPKLQRGHLPIDTAPGPGVSGGHEYTWARCWCSPLAYGEQFPPMLNKQQQYSSGTDGPCGSSDPRRWTCLSIIFWLSLKHFCSGVWSCSLSRTTYSDISLIKWIHSPHQRSSGMSTVWPGFQLSAENVSDFWQF